MERKHYETLGVPRTAPQEEILKKYRILAKTYHPDRNPGDKDAEARFKEVSEAYEVLRDPTLRSQYDLQGYVGRYRPASPPPPPQRKKPKKPDREVKPDWPRGHTREELDAVKCQFFGGNDRILLGRNILITLIIGRNGLGKMHEVTMKKRRSCNSCEAGNMDIADNWIIEKYPIMVPIDHPNGAQIIVHGRGEKGRGSGGIAGNLHVAVIIQ